MRILSGRDLSVDPCVNKCQPNEKICGGCIRNEYERANWRKFTPEHRDFRNKLIAHRKRIRSGEVVIKPRTRSK